MNRSVVLDTEDEHEVVMRSQDSVEIYSKSSHGSGEHGDLFTHSKSGTFSNESSLEDQNQDVISPTTTGLSDDYTEEQETGGIELHLEPDDYDKVKEKYVDTHPRKIGDINCLNVPSAPLSLEQFIVRVRDWSVLNLHQIMGGITVASTQVVEAVSYAIVIGVGPMDAVHSTLLVGLFSTLFNGRPGIVSGISNMTAYGLARIVQNHGLSYIFYSVLLAGILQLVFGLLGLGVLVRLIPHSVLLGFVNAMAVVIALFQFRLFKVQPRSVDEILTFDRNLIQPGYSYETFEDGESWNDTSVALVMAIEAILTFAVCMFLPRFTKKVSSPFIAILTTTVIEWILIRQIGYKSPVVDDYENVIDVRQILPTPVFHSDVFDLPPFNFETFKIVAISGFSIFGSNLLEGILTKKFLDDRLNDDKGQIHHFIVGQGFAQIISSLLGGVGGGAKLSQTMVLNSCEAFTNLAVVVSLFSLFLCTTIAGPIIGSTPLAATVGIMFYTSWKMCDLETFKKVFAAFLPASARQTSNMNHKIQRTESIIIFVVMLFTIFLDVGIAALTGILMSCIAYTWNSGDRLLIHREVDAEEETVTYFLSGHIFFGTKDDYFNIFSDEILRSDPRDVILNLEGAEVFDWTGMVSLKRLHDKLVEHDKVVAFSSLSDSSRSVMEKCSSMWEGVNFLFIEDTMTKDMTNNMSFSKSFLTQDGDATNATEVQDDTSSSLEK